MHTRPLFKERLSRAKTLCRANGLALTVQRRVILDALLDRTDHPTADAIFAAVAPRLPGLSRTTVYRVLEALVRVKVLRKVPHEGAVVRFDPRTDRHHHLVCDHCGALFDVPDCVAGQLDLAGLAGLGIRVTEYCIHFTGTCGGCRRASSKPHTKERR
jgi:Fur family peroxide stress response transcriptional regulator